MQRPTWLECREEALKKFPFILVIKPGEGGRTKARADRVLDGQSVPRGINPASGTPATD